VNKTKRKILENSIEIFNSKGVADVSLRFIAKEIGISHGNLMYHFKSKSEIIQGIHQMLLEKAIELNEGIDRLNFDITELYVATKKGFQVIHEFRFLLNELLYIVKTDRNMLNIIRSIEKTRTKMYEELIQLSIENGLMRKEIYKSEYDNLIKRIRIFSDHWLTSAFIYDGLEQEPDFDKYTNLFVDQFYPYLTEKGRLVVKNNN